ncbi:MAG: CZB domain-containing protein [Thermoleophilia bacterium]
MDLVQASQAHAEWKVRLRTAINKKEHLDAAAITADDRCALGQWLHGAGRAEYGSHAEFAAVVEKHAAFHREAGAVAAAINAGDFDRATGMLNPGTPYANATNAVGTALHGLKRVTL